MTPVRNTIWHFTFKSICRIPSKGALLLSFPCKRSIKHLQTRPTYRATDRTKNPCVTTSFWTVYIPNDKWGECIFNNSSHSKSVISSQPESSNHEITLITSTCDSGWYIRFHQREWCKNNVFFLWDYKKATNISDFWILPRDIQLWNVSMCSFT